MIVLILTVANLYFRQTIQSQRIVVDNEDALMQAWGGLKFNLSLSLYYLYPHITHLTQRAKTHTHSHSPALENL